MERSIQIRRPVLEVFSACAHMERMPQLVRPVVSVACCEDVSLWIADIEGRRYAWDAEIVQVIPKQVIGWMSHRGPKHSGRITFFSIGQATLIQVDMNYAAESTLASLMGGALKWNLSDILEAALRDLKLNLESEHYRWSEAPKPDVSEPVHGPGMSEQKATGTYGPLRSSSVHKEPLDGEEFEGDNYP